MTTKQFLLFSLLINSGIFSSIIAMYNPHPLPNFFFIQSNAGFKIIHSIDGLYKYPAPQFIYYQPGNICENQYQTCIQQTLHLNSTILREKGVKPNEIAFYHQRIVNLTDFYMIELVKLNSFRR